MRPIHVLLGLVVVLASGASAFVATRLAATPASEPIAAVAPTTAAPADASAAERARAQEERLAMVHARLDALADEVVALRDAARREPVAAPVAALPVEAAAAASQVTEEQRRTVLAVLAEEKAREAAEEAARRAQAEKENAERRAGRIAKDLGLSPGDQTRLAQLLLDDTQKRQEFFKVAMRDGMPRDRESLMAQREGYRKWQGEQYTQAFGAAVGGQILEQLEGDRPFGGPGGGGERMGARGGRRGTAANGGGGAPGAGAQQQD